MYVCVRVCACVCVCVWVCVCVGVRGCAYVCLFGRFGLFVCLVWFGLAWLGLVGFDCLVCLVCLLVCLFVCLFVCLLFVCVWVVHGRVCVGVWEHNMLRKRKQPDLRTQEEVEDWKVAEYQGDLTRKASLNIVPMT